MSASRPRPAFRRARLSAGHLRFAPFSLLCLVLLALGCQTFSRKQAEAEYGPSEGILEAVAVLRRHVPDDTYHFPPAIEFTGRNVYRASLLRLENLERSAPEAMRSGYMDPVLSFAKARALERLRAYDLAAQHYRDCARLPGELREAARQGADLNDRIAKAVTVGLELEEPLSDQGLSPLPLDAERIRLELDDRVDRLSSILGDVRDGHYRWIVQEEIERADEIRAHYFVEMRFALPNGHLLALQELQRVATRHGASKKRLRHLLRLADYYSELSREYLAAHPAEGLRFDPARFRELSDAAIQLYEVVSHHDGHPEKLEAARSLESYLAFTLGIDADRFDR